MGWFSDFQSFFADMFRQWVGRLTGPLSIILGVSPFVFPAFFSGDCGLVHTQWAWWAASALAFLIAAYSAWREEHGKRIEVERKYLAAEQKYEAERPLLGMQAHSVEGQKTWAQSPVPVTFTIHHLSGRVPTSIRFEPIPSKNGKFSLQFDPLAHVASGGFEPVCFEINESGAPILSARDIEETSKYRKQMLDLFLDDSPMELIKLDYGVAVHFMDGTDARCQRFTLTSDKQRWRISINPA